MHKVLGVTSIALMAIFGALIAGIGVAPDTAGATTAAPVVPTNIVTNSAGSEPAILGSSVTFTASVSGPIGSSAPTGTVKWTVSGTAGVNSCKTSKTTLNSGKATCDISVSNAGTYVVNDAYGGSTTYSPVASGPDAVSVASLVATDVVTDSSAPAKSVLLGTSITFTAAVSGPRGSSSPSGNVTWSVTGTAALGPCSTSTTLNAGKATCTVIATRSGTIVATDTYAGNAIYAPVTAATDTITVATGAVPTSIPVFVWHELNNGCSSSSAVCNASDVESVSTAQLTAELSYLVAQGYHSVTPSQYQAWTQGSQNALPLNPILLVADNGIDNFLAGAQSILKADGFTMAVAVVAGFADGASGLCSEPSYEGGCPVANDDGWDATWTQLAALSPSVYSFIIEAGTAGHFVQTYDSTCTVFYACEVSGESDAQYEARVEADLAGGQAEIIAKLGASRFTNLWVAPYSDDGYGACIAVGCTAQPYDGPAGWLTSWSATTFPVIFVEDAFRNGIQNERFRIDVQGWMTQSEFESIVTSDVSGGDFTLNNTPPPTPPPPPPIPTPPPTSTNPVAAIPVLSLDSTSMTSTQVSAELTYLHAQGENTITASSYLSWSEGDTVALPPNPILITVTGDNDAFLSSFSASLASAGFSALDFVSTQHADAGGTSATWAQLAALTPSAWQFAFAAGADGGTVVGTDPASCDIYYACEAPGETDSAYQARVAQEIGTGRLELDNNLWMQTVNDYFWSAPFGDAGQSGQPTNGPAGWLSQWASWVFPVVIVSTGASGDNQRDALQVTGSTSEATFEATLTADLAAGVFNG